MYSAKVRFRLEITCPSTELDAYLQYKTIMSNSLVSKAMHEIVLYELCLMHDHTFIKTYNGLISFFIYY